MVEVDSCIHKWHPKTVGADVVVHVRGVVNHGLVESPNFLPAITPDKEGAEVGALPEFLAWFRRSYPIHGVAAYSGDEWNVVAQERGVEPRWQVGVVVDDENVVCLP